MSLDRLELVLGVGGVVTSVRPAVRSGDSEGCDEPADRAARHRRTAVGMERELVGADLLLDLRLMKEMLSEVMAFTMGKHPGDHIAAVDVDDDLGGIVGPLVRPEELHDVPRTDLVRCGGHELRLGERRMSERISTFPHSLLASRIRY